MITRLRSLLLSPLFWLAMLAMPFGCAAAAPPCHHAQVRAAAVRMAAPAQSCALHQHGHRHGAGHAAGQDHTHCTSCPACCAGAAPAPAQLVALPEAGPAFVAIPFRAGHVPSVDPSLPERPPRSSFA